MATLYQPSRALWIRLLERWRQHRCSHYGWDRLAHWSCPDCGRAMR